MQAVLVFGKLGNFLVQQATGTEHMYSKKSQAFTKALGELAQ
jgi:hypothetical protein